MRLFKSTSSMVAAGALSLVLATPALANEPSAAEQQLEQRLRELEAQLEQVTAQLQAGQSTALEARVAELEATSSMDNHNGLGMYWDNGVRFDSTDGAFKFALGGRTYIDFTWPDADSHVVDAVEAANAIATGSSSSSSSSPYGGSIGGVGGATSHKGEINTAAEIRTARLYMAGTIYDNVGFKSEFDFAGGDADHKDVYIKVKGTCIGDVTIGHHKEPFGLDQLTSSRFGNFMERALVSDLTPGRNTGFSTGGSLADGQVHWRGGIFRDADSYGNDVGNVGDGEWAFTGRAHGVAWEDADEGQALHLGLSLSHRQGIRMFTGTGEDRMAGATSVASLHTAPFPLAGGTVTVDDETMLIGCEAAFNAGPWQVAAEYTEAELDLSGASDVTFEAWNLEGSYFLTGETRSYDRNKGVYSRTTPSTNYGDEDGNGAWQVAARAGSIDYDDGSVDGGDLDEWTIGLNWLLNANTRMMLNYSEIDIQHVGEIDLLGMRWQIDF